MRLVSWTFAALVCALTLLLLPSASLGGEPPNQNDPCSSGGRNTCGTLGVGSYRTYRYGLRWFGDYRGVIPGIVHMFCIDLQYWYPSPKYDYRESEAKGLKNRDGEAVTLANQQKIAYAVWQYGQSTDRDTQAAVMLYVHAMMGDARPGEVDPGAIGVGDLYAKVAKDAAAYHGPYRVDARLPEGMKVGKESVATVRILSAAGNALPNALVNVALAGATGAARQARTDASGVARIPITPIDTASVSLTATSGPLASTLPAVFAPTARAAARNGQRLVAPASQTVSGTARASASKSPVAVTTEATPAGGVTVGEQTRDKITITGPKAGWNARVAVKLFGPFTSTAEIRCAGKPYWTTEFTVPKEGTYLAPAAKIEQPGYFTYQVVVPATSSYLGLTTPCGVPAETIKAEIQPRIRTVVSAQKAEPGVGVYDKISVEGLAGQKVTIRAVLYGPFPGRDAIRCDGAAIWTGTVEADGDGDYETEPFVLTVPGYYTYQESIDATDFVRATRTACPDAAETTVLPGEPKILTQVSSTEIRPGAKLSDKAIITGLGGITATVKAELFGPFRTKLGISCQGKPAWTGSFVARGDGTYTTQPVTIQKVGYYTYRESIEPGPANAGVQTTCGEAAETAVARAEPTVTTLVSAEVVRPGTALFDLIQVKGLGRTAAAIDVQLFGPFASRAAVSCAGKPFWTGRAYAKGDGVLRSRAVRIPKAGFYTYRERLVGQPLVKETITECALAAETALGAPKITTGRGDSPRTVQVQGVGAATPTRVRIGSLGIDAPVDAVGIDLAKGELGVPADIRRLGWWRDGAAPGAAAGSVVIAGHVDSRVKGAGAFVALKRARVGDRITVSAAGGKTYAYKVTSVRTMPKSQLPLAIWTLRGPPKLVLVTCGGPFVPAIKHYRDNVVVTAVPA